jgi:hypothetical protein
VSINLVGDSITKGFGSGTFSDVMVGTDPFWDIRSLWSTIGLVLEENGAPFTCAYLNVGTARQDSTPAVLQACAENGIISPGDWVVFEDAGDHGGDPAAYKAGWIELAQAVRTVPDVNILMMTMFDYPPAPAGSQYDLAFGS